MKPTANSSKVLKDIFIGLGISAALFAFAEGGLRIYWKIRWPQDPRYWQWNEQAGFKYVPGFHSIEKSLVGFEGNVNSLGYRGPEWKKEKEPGVFRILCLGDSVVLGLWGTASDSSFPRQLEMLLNEKHPKQKFEVLNAGLGNNTSTQSLYRLKNELLAYHPDLVIVQVGINDMVEMNPTIPPSYQTRGWVRDLAKKSFLIRSTAGFLFKVALPKMTLSAGEVSQQKEKFEAYTPKTYQNNLIEIAEACKAQNVSAVFLTISFRMNTMDVDQYPERIDPPPYFARDRTLYRILIKRYNETVKLAGQATGTPVIDMAQYIAAIPNGTEYFQDFAHFNNKGYALYAKELMQRLKQEHKL